jgi:peptidoglycan/xylan/chitin deacetylase (PgdA/CDA1 family)
MSSRIVVFTSNLAYSVRKGIVETDKAVADLQWLIVLGSPRRSVGQLVCSQWRNLRRNGWRWVPYQTADIWNRVRERFGALQGPGPVGAEYSSSALQARPNVRVLQVADINAESTCTAVREFVSDLGLSLAAPILRPALFSIPRLGTINLHKGKLPCYRGMPPAFWELWNGEQSVGCTIHRMDEKLDTGEILCETRVDREKFSTVRGLQLRLDELGVELMREAVQQVLSGTARATPQPAGGKTYRKPTLTQMGDLRRKLLDGQRPSAGTLKRLATEVIGSTAFFAWRLGLRHLLAPRISVLLYHRVSDDARDNLTVGIEQFDRQIALISRYCQPLSIEEVLDCAAVPRTGKPLVCVTFDDGYLDNYQNAAPILIKHQVPAAFFVSTGLIGTQERFPHDVRRGNPVIPLMRWDQLRDMRAAGFVIGSHSVSHIDCAAETQERVRSELEKSRADLQRELGLERVIFAYPYGGREHMTAERLELVKQAGYAGCLSAYGGTNVRAVSRFNVLRRGIHWEFSDRALLLECLGLR